MRLEGEAYSKRLESLSDSTIQMIADLNSFDMETAVRKTEIVANSEYSEKEIVQKLKELLETKTTK